MQDAIASIKKFFNDVNEINSQIDEIRNQIRNAIKEFLKAWKQLSQKVDKEELIKLWESFPKETCGKFPSESFPEETFGKFLSESSGMPVDDKDSDSPIFWFSGYASINREGSDVDVSLYLRRGDDALYADDELPDFSYPVDNGDGEEYRVNLHACNLDDLMEIMDTIYYSLQNFKLRLLSGSFQNKDFSSRKAKKQKMAM